MVQGVTCRGVKYCEAAAVESWLCKTTASRWLLPGLMQVALVQRPLL